MSKYVQGCITRADIRAISVGVFHIVYSSSTIGCSHIWHAAKPQKLMQSLRF
ncbi:hypothetical protein BDV27DRAFT_107927 [Aspergillus caelatus]|uniref:Uncharacterized protein n=1 Tax=Aspergillus caelatus TaxID=61420 RepID=A0A5N7A708_9EURO|nr:uncharacterized protein BDV27DRAFT_107927 [Aspergillus caelatus]KAE8364996.1 hypothetical protein BDV27DRAFT_107927 [Aspergillus caelatus]